eukprot:1136630-Pelagomonas_calceolata.AAC.6
MYHRGAIASNAPQQMCTVRDRLLKAQEASLNQLQKLHSLPGSSQSQAKKVREMLDACGKATMQSRAEPCLRFHPLRKFLGSFERKRQEKSTLAKRLLALRKALEHSRQYHSCFLAAVLLLRQLQGARRSQNPAKMICKASKSRFTCRSFTICMLDRSQFAYLIPDTARNLVLCLYEAPKLASKQPNFMLAGFVIPGKSRFNPMQSVTCARESPIDPSQPLFNPRLAYMKRAERDALQQEAHQQAEKLMQPNSVLVGHATQVFREVICDAMLRRVACSLGRTVGNLWADGQGVISAEVGATLC